MRKRQLRRVRQQRVRPYSERQWSRSMPSMVIPTYPKRTWLSTSMNLSRSTQPQLRFGQLQGTRRTPFSHPRNSGLPTVFEAYALDNAVGAVVLLVVADAAGRHEVAAVATARALVGAVADLVELDQLALVLEATALHPTITQPDKA